jgi:hypothetical protein
VDGAVRIRQIVDLQAGDVLLDRGFTRQQGRHHHERAQGWRDAVAELEARQRSRPEQLRDGAIDERDREVGGRNQRDESQQEEGRGTHTGGVRGEEGQGQDQPRPEADGAEIARRRPGDVGSKKPPR